MGDELETQEASPLENQPGQPSPRPRQPARVDVADADEDRPVTLRELRAAQNDLDTRYRRTQGAVDRSEQRIFDRLRQDLAGVDGLGEELRGIGVELTPQQQEALRQRRLMRTFQEPPESPQPRGRAPNREPSPAEAETEFNPVAATADAAWAIMTQEYGVVVEEKDPEFAMIDVTTTKPSRLLATVREAAEAKARRLGRLQDEEGETGGPPPPAPQPNSRARAGAGGRRPAAPSSFEGRKAMDLFKEGYSKTTPT